MGLERALQGLADDRATEKTVREMLQLMSNGASEWLRASDLARRLEAPESRIAVILSRLADGFVLSNDGDRYRYVHDPVVDLDVKRFLAKSEAHSRLAQDNLARFRDRFGQH
jgi:DNA-binding IclR family transcriptional regulator